MTRFQKLAAATVVTAILLVTIGVIVRATGSGLGCPDWPLCHGQLIPPLDDYKAWIEWVHRTVAVIIGFEVIGLAALALISRDVRERRTLLIAAVGSVLLVGFQAWLGRETVRLGNSGESVTAHLAAAMALVGLLVWILARSLYPARLAGTGSQRFTLVAALGAGSVYALLLFGSHVTATSQWYVFPDWPLMGGSLFPAITEANSAHVLHRWIAVIVGVIVAAVFVAAWRHRPRTRPIIRLAAVAAVLFPIQAVVGGLQILTGLSGWTQTLHLALGAIIWALLVALVAVAYLEARSEGVGATAPGTGTGTRSPSARSEGRLGDTVRAYIALTKPRIIELLLVTTVPAMVLATREVPGIQLGHWTWLTVWTLIGGTLAAGSANAINCYLDRDIDELMNRTRRRPLPAHQVEPERAVVFGLALGAVSFAVLAFFVNLLAAFLGLLAIAFYVVIYTLLLKRSTPQNIVIGGAAGALPPVIGWAAVTGNVGIPALILFALVFFAVGRMGWIYLAAAVVLGAIFLRQAVDLWRVGAAEEASTAGAIRLY
ncbi:MAG TPA: heme o synthase, partial [Candidatus Limnocylindrales bacterium]|nr:heme o synthase [Candidatus Limnocylindrales bacterium]